MNLKLTFIYASEEKKNLLMHQVFSEFVHVELQNLVHVFLEVQANEQGAPHGEKVNYH